MFQSAMYFLRGAARDLTVHCLAEDFDFRNVPHALCLELTCDALHSELVVVNVIVVEFW